MAQLEVKYTKEEVDEFRKINPDIDRYIKPWIWTTLAIGDSVEYFERKKAMLIESGISEERIKIRE